MPPSITYAHRKTIRSVKDIYRDKSDICESHLRADVSIGPYPSFTRSKTVYDMLTVLLSYLSKAPLLSKSAELGKASLKNIITAFHEHASVFYCVVGKSQLSEKPSWTAHGNITLLCDSYHPK